MADISRRDQTKPRFSDRFHMRERIKAMLAMVGTGSAVTNATERQVVIGELPGGIVYAGCPKLRLFQPFLFLPAAARKHVKR